MFCENKNSKVWRQKFKVRIENKDALEGQYKELQFHYFLLSEIEFKLGTWPPN